MSAFIPSTPCFIPRSSRAVYDVSRNRYLSRIPLRRCHAARIVAAVDMSTIASVPLPAIGVDSGKLTLSEIGARSVYVILYLYVSFLHPQLFC